jgi:peroxiredoxin
MTNVSVAPAVGSPLPALGLHGPGGSAVPQPGTPTVVYLMRAATCGVCRRHVRSLARRHDEVRSAGADVLVVVPEGAVAAAELRRELGLPFEVLGGGGSVHEALGLRRRLFGNLQESGSLLVDAAGVVRHLRSGALPTQAFDERALFDELARLR